MAATECTCTPRGDPPSSPVTATGATAADAGVRARSLAVEASMAALPTGDANDAVTWGDSQQVVPGEAAGDLRPTMPAAAALKDSGETEGENQSGLRAAWLAADTEGDSSATGLDASERIRS